MQMHYAQFAPAGGIQELSFDEVGGVTGGFVPVALAGAILATTAVIGFVDGVFTGINEDEQRKAAKASQ